MFIRLTYFVQFLSVFLERKLEQLKEEMSAKEKEERRRREKHEEERLKMKKKFEKLQREKEEEEQRQKANDESKLDDNWEYREETRVYEEKTTRTDLNIAVEKIADAIVGTVSAMATGGALAPVLIKSMKNVVISASWGQINKNEKVVKKLFGSNVCIYLEIDRITRSTNENLMCASCETLHIYVSTKFVFMTAKSQISMKELLEMKAKQAKDKLDYMNAAPGWCDDNKYNAILQQQQNESICSIQGMCVIL